MNTEEVLHGGVANAGAVVRVGPHVLRPSNPHTPSVHRFLRALRDAGFDGSSEVVGIDDDGRERLVFVAGDVAVPPYPEWAQRDEALASTAELLRRFHDASRSFVPAADDSWSVEMADPAGRAVVCHNDVCLENVVFRDGHAVALLDFDFAAPGRPVYDLAQFTRMCVPVDDDRSAGGLGWQPADRPARLRLVADAYGLDAADRHALLDVLDDSITRGGEFLRRRVAAGDAPFVAVWEEIGGMERFDRRRRWWATARPAFQRAMS